MQPPLLLIDKACTNLYHSILKRSFIWKHISLWYFPVKLPRNWFSFYKSIFNPPPNDEISTNLHQFPACKCSSSKTTFPCKIFLWNYQNIDFLSTSKLKKEKPYPPVTKSSLIFISVHLANVLHLKPHFLVKFSNEITKNWFSLYKLFI